MRLDATVGGNGGGRYRQRRRRQRGRRHLDRVAGAGLLRHRHRDATRPTATTPSQSYLALRADRPFSRGKQRLRRHGERRAHPARRRRTRCRRLHRPRTRRQRRADRRSSTSAGRHGDDAGARLRHHAGRGRATALGAIGSDATVARWSRPTHARLAALRRRPARAGPDAPCRAHEQRRQRKRPSAYYVSANVVKASEDKTFPGAIVASLASPWGQAVSAGDPANTYFGSYREVFARDLYEAWTALLTDGDLATARAADPVPVPATSSSPTARCRATRWSTASSRPTRSTPSSTRSAYPILMALQSGLADDATLWPHIKAAANFLDQPRAGVRRRAVGGAERLLALDHRGRDRRSGRRRGTIAQQHGDAADARVWLATADLYQRSIKSWTVTTNGDRCRADPYFIRLSKTGDPNAAISYSLGNGGPTLDQRDGHRRRLPRAGPPRRAARRPTRPSPNSLSVVDATIEKHDRRAARAGCATTATATATATARAADRLRARPVRRGRRVGHGHRAHLAGARGRARPSRTSPPARRPSAAHACSRPSTPWPPGVGLVPEQVWDAADVPASPVRHRPDRRRRSASTTASRPVRRRR